MLAIGNKNISKGALTLIVLLAFKGLFEEAGLPSSIRFFLEFLMVIIFSLLSIKWFNYALKDFINSNRWLKYYFFYTIAVCVLGILFFPSYSSISLIVNAYLVILALPIVSFLFYFSSNLRVLSNSVIYILLPLSLIKFFGPPKVNMSNFSGYVSIIYILILFLPYIKSTKTKLIIVIFSYLSFTYELNDRTNILMLSGSLFIMLVSKYYVKLGINKKRLIINFLVLLPIAFLILGWSGIFNIFELSNLIDSTDISNVDTRTLLYSEVSSDTNIIHIIFGRTAAGGYESSLASVYNLSYLYRQDTECGILIYYLKGGLLWCFIYISLIYTSAIKSIYSNNILSSSMGLYLMLYLIVSFIELQPSFNNWTVTLFIALGITNSIDIRKKTNKENIK